MYRYVRILVVLLVAVVCVTASDGVPSPEDRFGFQPGADGKLVRYKELIDYLQVLDDGSDRILMMDVGKSPMGKPMKICFMSAPENLAHLEELKDMNRQLATSPLSPEQLATITQQGRVFVMATLSMHSSEVGPSQALPQLAWMIATGSQEDLTGWLNDVVLMVIPCHNPDGMDMIVDHYRKYVGTKYEGSTLPGIYHKYVGHDNNRDFVTLSQTDTQAISDTYSTAWYPQVLVEKHQMGSSGPRYFVPEYHDPIAENVDEEMWTWIDVFGANLSRDMTADGCSGVASHWAFDDYWPGSTETSLWKNVISILTEGASCKIATPVYVEPQELRVRGKGLSEYRKGVNMPDPWPGGWWRLSDIVRYELSSIRSIVRTASVYRTDILKFRNRLCMKEIEKGTTQPPAYVVIPAKQHDPGERDALADLLMRHGVNVYQATETVENADHRVMVGDLVIPLAQPYRAFIKEVLEAQSYPVRHYTPDGEIIRPYDIASWSLPLHRGVNAFTIDQPATTLDETISPVTAPFHSGERPRYKSGTVVLPAAWNISYSLAFQAMGQDIPVSRVLDTTEINGNTLHPGDFLVTARGKKVSILDRLVSQLPEQPVTLAKTDGIQSRKLTLPKIGIVETYFHDMDAGWTRFVLDSAKIPFTVIRPGEMVELDLNNFDVIVFPNSGPDVLMKGSYKSGSDYYVPDMPSEYRKGMGDKGMLNLTAFINKGGIVLSWGASTGLFTQSLKESISEDETESFRLPVRDVGDQMKKAGLYVPGSLLQVKLKENHPVTFGMGHTCDVFSRGTPVFQTSIPGLDMDRRILAVYPETDILTSGYGEHVEKLANRAAAVWVKKGKGQLVLLAFSPQFRSSTSGLYKLMFNTLLLK